METDVRLGIWLDDGKRSGGQGRG